MQPDRRAFAMGVVLVLVMVISVIVTGVLQRYSAQQRTVQRQVAEYRMHHDMFGVQAMALQWLARARVSDIVQIADTDEVAFGFALPDGKQVAVYIEDGQDTALATTEGIQARDKPFYDAMLARLPEDRPDLLRSAGPAAISINHAPEVLVRALFGPDLDMVADEIIRTRKRGEVDRGVVAEALTDAGASVEAQQALTALVALDPALWRLRIQTDDGFEPREFEMLVEMTTGRPMMHAWRERFARAGDGADTEDDDRQRRRRR
jgi:type II secretory pathway component PulK